MTKKISPSAQVIKFDLSTGKIISRRSVQFWSAHAETPPCIDVMLNEGPDDNGHATELIINTAALVKELKKYNLV